VIRNAITGPGKPPRPRPAAGDGDRPLRPGPGYQVKPPDGAWAVADTKAHPARHVLSPALVPRNDPEMREQS
jgi:hypothetical protein